MSLPRRTAFVALAVAAVLAGGGPSWAEDSAPTPSAPGDDLVSFGIAPAGPDRPDDRPYVAVSASAGSVVYEHVAIVNTDDQPIELQVYSGDVSTAEGGGLTVTTKDQSPTDAGAWVSITGPSAVTVPAQTPATGYGFTIVPLVISIPADAEPGDHIAGLVAGLISDGQGGTNAPAVELEQRVAARLYIQVTGALEPAVQIRDLRTTWEPSNIMGNGRAVVTVTLVNTGNMRMAVEPRARVSGPFGALPRSAAGGRVDELLPGDSVELSIPVDGVWPLIAESVTVDAVTVAAPAGADPGLGTVTEVGHFWAIPWLMLSILLLLIVLLVWWWLSRRRAVQPQPAGLESDLPAAVP